MIFMFGLLLVDLASVSLHGVTEVLPLSSGWFQLLEMSSMTPFDMAIAKNGIIC